MRRTCFCLTLRIYMIQIFKKTEKKRRKRERGEEERKRRYKEKEKRKEKERAAELYQPRGERWRRQAR